MRSAQSDGWPIEIAAQTITPTGSEPLSFAIEYDPLAIAANSPYAIFAEMRVDDDVLLRAQWHNVITNGGPDMIEVILLPVSYATAQTMRR